MERSDVDMGCDGCEFGEGGSIDGAIASLLSLLISVFSSLPLCGCCWSNLFLSLDLSFGLDVCRPGLATAPALTRAV